MRVRAFRSYNFSRRTDLNFPSIFSEVAAYLSLQDLRDFSFFFRTISAAQDDDLYALRSDELRR
jgi:hypothetical protein